LGYFFCTPDDEWAVRLMMNHQVQRCKSPEGDLHIVAAGFIPQRACSKSSGFLKKHRKKSFLIAHFDVSFQHQIIVRETGRELYMTKERLPHVMMDYPRNEDGKKSAT